jgi:hypothetical protein
MANETDPDEAERTARVSADAPLGCERARAIDRPEREPGDRDSASRGPEGPASGADAEPMRHTNVAARAATEGARGKRGKDVPRPTARQLAANRANAKRSTGPRTIGGKDRVARNAVKHGLLSKVVVVGGEEASAFEALARRMRADLAPVGAAEEALVDLFVAGLWRLRHFLGIEAELFAARQHAEARGDAIAEMRRLMTGDVPGVEIVRDNFRGIATQPFATHPGVQAALARAMQCDNALRSPGVRQARAFAAEAATFATLSRYAASIERSMFRAFHELQRLQAQRRGDAVPLPVAADVTVDLTTPGPGGRDA